MKAWFIAAALAVLVAGQAWATIPCGSPDSERAFVIAYGYFERVIGPKNRLQCDANMQSSQCLGELVFTGCPACVYQRLLFRVEKLIKYDEIKLNHASMRVSGASMPPGRITLNPELLAVEGNEDLRGKRGILFATAFSESFYDISVDVCDLITEDKYPEDVKKWLSLPPQIIKDDSPLLHVGVPLVTKATPPIPPLRPVAH